MSGASVPASRPGVVAASVSDVLRTFVALVPSDAMAGALSEEAARLARVDPAVHAVEREHLHLTLAFLGATPSEAVPRIVDALRSALAGASPVRLRPVALSAFPSPQAPRVLFAELAPDTRPELGEVSRRVVDALVAAGWGPEGAERFHPHITLARIRRRSDPERPPRALEKLLTAGSLQGTYIDDMVTEVGLLSSEPAPAGPHGSGRVYRVLASVPLGPGARAPIAPPRPPSAPSPRTCAEPSPSPRTPCAAPTERP